MNDAARPLLDNDREEGAGVGTGVQFSTSTTPTTSRASKAIDGEDNQSVYIKFDPYRIESTSPDSFLRERNRKPSMLSELKDKNREWWSRAHQLKWRPILIAVTVLALFTAIVVMAAHSGRKDDNKSTTNNPGSQSSLRADAPPISLTSRGAWYYPRGEPMESVSAAIRELGLDFVVISASADKLSDPESFQSTVQLFSEIQSVGVRPVVMTLQGPTFAYTENLQRALDLINGSLELCNAIETCNEIHLDIEPHTLDEWSSGTPEQKQDILDQMTIVINTVQGVVSERTDGEVTVSAAITWWMLSNPGLSLQLDPSVKFYVMSYGGVGDSATEILSMLSKKDTLGLRNEQYFVGVGINEFSNKVEGAMQAAEIIEKTITEELFSGVCFYSLNFAVGEDE